MTSSPTVLGERLRRERLTRDETQAETAARFGIGQSSYHRWESGDAEPRPNRYAAVGEFLGIPGTEVYALIKSEHVPTSLEDIRRRIQGLQRELLDNAAATGSLRKEIGAQRLEIDSLRADLNLLKMAVGGPAKRK